MSLLFAWEPLVLSVTLIVNGITVVPMWFSFLEQSKLHTCSPTVAVFLQFSRIFCCLFLSTKYAKLLNYMKNNVLPLFTPGAQHVSARCSGATIIFTILQVLRTSAKARSQLWRQSNSSNTLKYFEPLLNGYSVPYFYTALAVTFLE